MVDEKQCLFCRIARGEIPAKKVYEDGECVAFLDINPRNPGHALVIPRKHYETLLDMPDGETGEYFRSVKRVAGLVKNGMNAQGISISSSNGQAAGQVVAHLHFHVIPRFAAEGPPGLESMLSSKRLDDKAMDQIAQAIAKASPEPAAMQDFQPSAPQPRQPAPRPVQAESAIRAAPRPTTAMNKTEQSKKKRDGEDEEEFESIDDEISFDF